MPWPGQGISEAWDRHLACQTAHPVCQQKLQVTFQLESFNQKPVKQKSGAVELNIPVPSYGPTQDENEKPTRLNFNRCTHLIFTVGHDQHALAELPFENDGNLYVSMYNSDTYHIFTKESGFVGTMTAPGLNGPRGLAFNPVNGDIWVTGEFSNTIYIFDQSNQFLRSSA